MVAVPLFRPVAPDLLGDQLLSSRAHANNIVPLLSLLKSSTEIKDVSVAMRSLQAYFLSCLERGEIAPAYSMAEQPEGSDPGAVFSHWMRNRYKSYVKALLLALARPVSPSPTQVAALDALLGLVKAEQPGQLSCELFSQVVSCLVGSHRLSSDVASHFAATYGSYNDIRYFLYANIRRFAAKRLSPLQGVELSSDEEVDGKQASTHTFVRNVFDILLRLHATLNKEPACQLVDSSVQAAWCTVPGRAASGKWLDLKNRKKTLAECWLTVLRLPLPMDVCKTVLLHLQAVVMPHLPSPLLLADFLTDAYGMGGVVSVLALDGLFVLMTQHALEYPDFYNKLYALLEPSIFFAKHRARFFQLLDTCLSSSHLPAYVAAAFAKRLGRCALAAPPSGALIVIALVHNLVRRHPAISTLVHHQKSAKDTSGAVDQPPLSLRGDPFLADEPNTAKCRALESSLWELDTLRHHYNPAVVRLVPSLEADLTVRAKTKEMNISEFTSGAYSSLIKEEATRRLKKVALAFYAKAPGALLSEAMAGDADPDRDGVFGGWVFEKRKTQGVRRKAASGSKPADADDDGDDDDEGEEEEEEGIEEEGDGDDDEEGDEGEEREDDEVGEEDGEGGDDDEGEEDDEDGDEEEGGEDDDEEEDEGDEDEEEDGEEDEEEQDDEDDDDEAVEDDEDDEDKPPPKKLKK